VNLNIENKILSTTVLPPDRSLSRIVFYCDSLENAIETYPPVKVNQRFGNPAYKDWHKHMCEIAADIIGDILGIEINEKESAENSSVSRNVNNDILALIPYFTDSFGNSTRIDYGTGHELAFIGFLTCVAQYRKNQYTPNDYTYIGLKLFPRYLKLVRSLQTKYRMEPAGII
jgi:serine/threonine-protein phosphatase 2A activator